MLGCRSDCGLDLIAAAGWRVLVDHCDLMSHLRIGKRDGDGSVFNIKPSKIELTSSRDR